MKRLATNLRSPVVSVGERSTIGRAIKSADARLNAPAELRQGGALADASGWRNGLTDGELADVLEAEMMGIIAPHPEYSR
jgi:hypothetical protein